ncbi:allergen Tha p 1-like [Melitaea cinxia]|uniref:allergen Tha p 1-like n=1 Tax=Melitaea cinxia TaxID=113334 RepID=UPI0006453A36|nr:allergen Tha p 1-like [Melitaea cinxia]
MKTFLCLCALVAIAFALPEDKYTDKYDKIDVDELLSNRRLLIPYIKCILDEGKCSADGRELKSHLEEALENDCAKCTDAQKKGTKKVIRHLINNEPDYWSQIVAKYDPEHKYSVKFEEEYKNH